MTPIRRVALAELLTGWVLAQHPTRSLRLLGYPDDGPLARATVRVLGARELVQGGVQLRDDPTTTWLGAAVDVVHALTCLVYARRSDSGRRAGLRSAALALSFAAAQAAVARRAAAGNRTAAPLTVVPRTAGNLS